MADGEGSFYPNLEKRIGNRTGFRLHACFQICNTNMTLLNEVISVLGCGTIRLIHRAKNMREKDGYVVDFNRREVLSVVPRLLPFLVGKKRQAEIILELCRRMYGNNVRYTQEEWNLIINLYNECRMLNKRGREPYIPISPSAIRPAQYITSDKRCSEELCNGKHYGKSYCRKHYRQKVEFTQRNKKPCSVEGCGIKMFARGVCRKHLVIEKKQPLTVVNA